MCQRAETQRRGVLVRGASHWDTSRTLFHRPSSPFCFPRCGLFRRNRARLRGWPISASFAPLDIHKYVFGGESCINRHTLEGSALLRRRNKPRLATLVEFGPVARDTARDRASSSSLPFDVVLLPRHPSSIRVAILRRRDTDVLVSLASRRVCREPQSDVSLRSSSSALPSLTRSLLLIC